MFLISSSLVMYLLALCTLTSKANENLIVAQNQRKAKSPEKKKKILQSVEVSISNVLLVATPCEIPAKHSCVK